MNLRNLIERTRDSQFLIPAAAIAASLLLAFATNKIDEAGTGSRYLIPASVGAARTLMATVAGAIITVAALVFSLTAVTVQLAASQYSPRVVQEFMRDRSQQFVVGLVMGTFTFSLASLPAVGTSADAARADWTATIAVALGIASAVSIVWFIDHITRRIRIDDTVRRISERAVAAFDGRADAPTPSEGWDLPSDMDSGSLRATSSGFVQEVDLDAITARLPSGAIARLDTWSGFFVAEGNRLLTLWPATAIDEATPVASAIVIGPTRTIEQDPGLGIRQLVDIALRALSPGVNDPATAADVVRYLAVCIRAAQRAGAPSRVFTAENGARLVTPHAPTASDHLATAFAPIRRAAADQPLVLAAIVESLTALADELEDQGSDSSFVMVEAEAAESALAAVAEAN